MKITQVVFREPKNNSNQELLQIVDLVFDDALKIRDILLCKGDRGHYISYPRRKTAEGGFYEIFHTIDHSLRNYIYKEIMQAYSKR